MHGHILNQKFTITRHRNIQEVSGNEKKINMNWLNIFVLNINTN